MADRPVERSAAARSLAQVNREPGRGTIFVVVTLLNLVARPLTRRDWRGQDKIPQTGGVVFVVNHISNADPIALGQFLAFSGRWPRFLAKASLFRIPVLGPYGFGLISTRFLPLEISPFVDMGWAWRRGESPDFRIVTGDEARITGDRIPVFSTGISARTNLFGYAILEVYYAHPFQRPDRGAHFGFQLAPGW